MKVFKLKDRKKYVDYLLAKFKGKSKKEVLEIFEDTLVVMEGDIIEPDGEVWLELNDLRSFVAAILFNQYGIDFRELTLQIEFYIGGVLVNRNFIETGDNSLKTMRLTRAFYSQLKTKELGKNTLIYQEDLVF